MKRELLAAARVLGGNRLLPFYLQGASPGRGRHPVRVGDQKDTGHPHAVSRARATTELPPADHHGG